MLYRLTENEPYYDMENPKERLYLRADLEDKGFFKIEGNMQYWSWFELPVLTKEAGVDLFNAMRLFAYTLIPTVKN